MSSALKPGDTWPKDFKPFARNINDSQGKTEYILVFPDPFKPAKDWVVKSYRGNGPFRDFQLVMAKKAYRIGRCSAWQRSDHFTEQVG